MIRRLIAQYNRKTNTNIATFSSSLSRAEYDIVIACSNVPQYRKTQTVDLTIWLDLGLNNLQKEMMWMKRGNITLHKSNRLCFTFFSFLLVVRARAERLTPTRLCDHQQVQCEIFCAIHALIKIKNSVEYFFFFHRNSKLIISFLFLSQLWRRIKSRFHQKHSLTTKNNFMTMTAKQTFKSC